MSLNKKPMATTNHADVRRALMDLSKAALADIVVDLIRGADGDAMDGHSLLLRVVKVAEPVLALRGDVVPKSHKTRGLP